MLVKNKPEDFNSSQKHLRDYLREKLKFNGHVKREREYYKNYLIGQSKVGQKRLNFWEVTKIMPI